MTLPGFFLVFEGGDGAGKSTHAARVTKWLRSPEGGSRKVFATREPGGTPLGAELRGVLMHGGSVWPRAEALLYAADRAEHVAQVVRPALERGMVVVQDRYIDSSVVYQGMARGLGDEVERISMWAVEGLLPDLTLVLDSGQDPARLPAKPDRLERELASAAGSIRDGFVSRAALAPQRYAVIDASGPVEDVQAEVRRHVATALAAKANS